MVAVEMGLRAAVEDGAQHLHLVIRSDNTGVVGALDGGKSRNIEVNRVLRRIVTYMMQSNIWLSTKWVASADNIADAPSRGLPPGLLPRRKFKFRVPYPIKDWVEEVA
ncbi:hypothetical protein AURDEDRAFT_172364 [Auricularia subglabra TFB-10046 SS5]|nr:hypothetical protein AURDEDRAFT_172364 [Auricularia subglabra TFB-10046 SS5]